MEKDKEIENLQASALINAQELAIAKGTLLWEQQTQWYLMTSGINEVMAKVRANHEYGKLVGRLTPTIQS